MFAVSALHSWYHCRQSTSLAKMSVVYSLLKGPRAVQRPTKACRCGSEYNVSQSRRPQKSRVVPRFVVAQQQHGVYELFVSLLTRGRNTTKWCTQK